MKESEFIELLNLYVDREISPEDAARLETEVMGDPDRHRIYQQYCRMHKACRVLAEQFQETAPEAAPRWAAAAERGGGWKGGWYATGLLAAAALVMVAFVRTRSNSPSQAEQAVVVAPPAEASQQPLANDLHSVVAVRDLSLSGQSSETSPEALLEASNQQGPFAWMSQVQMTPIRRLPIEQANFSQPALIGDSRSLPASNASASQADMAALQFQR